MANGSENTETMVERMVEEGGGTERNATPPESTPKQQKRKSKKLPQPIDDPNVWEPSPSTLRSPVG